LNILRARDKKPWLFASTQPNQGSSLSLPSHNETLEIDEEFEKTFTRYYSELILRRLHGTLPILTVASLKFELAHMTLNNSIGYSISIPSNYDLPL
jgi:hypothetical protein